VNFASVAKIPREPHPSHPLDVKRDPFGRLSQGVEFSALSGRDPPSIGEIAEMRHYDFAPFAWTRKASMSDQDSIPKLADWAGGPETFRRLFLRFYARVAEDEILAPIFATMDPRHVEHVAHFVCEVLGGAKSYSATGGSHAGMIAHHMGRKLTQEQRRAWVALLLSTADELGLPDDPEFRASLVGYLEWGSRLAVMNSQDGVAPPEADMPMPEWTWSSPGGPYRP